MREIKQIEKEYTKNKEWYHTGEVTIKNRPKNSLLKTTEIEFKQISPNDVTKEEDEKLKKIFMQKIKNEEFCNLIINKRLKEDEVSESLSDDGSLHENDATVIEEALQGIEADIRQMSDFNEKIANFPTAASSPSKASTKRKTQSKGILRKLKRNKNVTLLN